MKKNENYYMIETEKEAMNMKKDLYTVSEFAQLCGTTKDTLIHYDEKGLLKPAVTGENKYRYYSSRQYYFFRLIKSLQEAGFSLDEIKEKVDSRDRQVLAKELSEKKENLEKRLKEIEDTILFVEDMILSISENEPNCGEIEIKHLNEEYLIATKANCFDDKYLVPDKSYYKDPNKNKYYCNWEITSEHVNYMFEKRYINRPFVFCNDMIDPEDFNNNKFCSTYRYNKIASKQKDQCLKIRKKGEYAFMYFEDSWSNVGDCCKRFKETMAASGYEIKDYVYVDYLFLGNVMNTPEHCDFMMYTRIG